MRPVAKRLGLRAAAAAQDHGFFGRDILAAGIAECLEAGDLERSVFGDFDLFRHLVPPFTNIV